MQLLPRRDPREHPRQIAIGTRGVEFIKLGSLDNLRLAAVRKSQLGGDSSCRRSLVAGQHDACDAGAAECVDQVWRAFPDRVGHADETGPDEILLLDRRAAILGAGRPVGNAEHPQRIRCHCEVFCLDGAPALVL